MYIVNLGAGRVGYMLARQLIDEGKDVALIELNSDRAKTSSNNLDCLVLNASGTNLVTLKKAGINKADAFVSVTESDEINMIACGLVSTEFSKPVTIARVRNMDYSDSKLIENSILGIDHLINPDKEASSAILRALEHGAISDVMKFVNGKIEMRDILLARESIFINRPLKKIRNELDFDFLITVIIREKDSIIPDGETILRENDRVYILSNEEVFKKIYSLEKLEGMEINKILLIGGGDVGAYISEAIFGNYENVPNILGKLKNILLNKKKKKLHIIDKNYERTKVLSERFPQALVTCQDVMDEGVLEDEELLKNDLIISATGNHELNIITGSYAKSLGIKKAISLVLKDSYRHMAHNLNLDVTISRNATVVNSILKILRKGNIKNVYTISGGKLEVIEFTISDKSILVGKKLSNIKLPKNTLIILISRREKIIIPYGSLVLENNDQIAVITERESIKKMEGLLVE
ncbi:MAG: Trk system potassium transporter TrkA [Spirochaetia bacterium]|jgi:trk system potassium uptake protein TrkA|nr:Trk system potassium transporter TrkA [Spirochaetia bacterium]